MKTFTRSFSSRKDDDTFPVEINEMLSDIASGTRRWVFLLLLGESNLAHEKEFTMKKAFLEKLLK